jgi:hypothetical protein
MRAAVSSALRPEDGDTLRDLPTDTLPHRTHLHDAVALGRLRVLPRPLDATEVVAYLVDSFPAALTPKFEITDVHLLSSSLVRFGSPPYRTGRRGDQTRLPKKSIAKATLDFSG